ncbi:MAG TPA: hypothetical protein VEB19_07535 [Gemmatimonadaceae bacterium]|nr:hypothetical protein [Gemmatimonadaceae bacterium]
MRVSLSLALIVAMATPISAQATKSPTPQGTKAADTKAADTKATTTKAAQNTKAAPRQGLSVAPEAPARAQIPVIMREVYDYDAGGRRDPFLSLLSSEDLRPAIADLKLVNIIFDESGRRPIAVMRDVLSNTQYRVTTGSTLGRMKVALIKRRAVIFSIEEFGLNRLDSLVLGDTSKVRTQ